MNIRRAKPGDEVELTAMIHELAEFERASDECTVTETKLRTALFGDAPTVYAHIAEEDGQAAAGALWHHGGCHRIVGGVTGVMRALMRFGIGVHAQQMDAQLLRQRLRAQVGTRKTAGNQLRARGRRGVISPLHGLHCHRRSARHRIQDFSYFG